MDSSFPRETNVSNIIFVFDLAYDPSKPPLSRAVARECIIKVNAYRTYVCIALEKRIIYLVASIRISIGKKSPTLSTENRHAYNSRYIRDRRKRENKISSRLGIISIGDPFKVHSLWVA